MENNQTEMDVDHTGGDNTKNVKNVAASDYEVSLHPMVILNISECHTRNKIQNPNNVIPLVGALIGKHQGRKIEILNSYELLLKNTNNIANANKSDDSSNQIDDSDIFSDMNAASSSSAVSQTQSLNDSGTLELDQEYFESKVEQFKQVFPDYELVGWFSIGEIIDDFDKHMFIKVGKMCGKASEKFSENPLVLKLNALVSFRQKFVFFSFY